MLWMLVTESFWKQAINRLTQKLFSAVTKNDLGLRVDHFDEAGLIDHDHGVRCGFYYLTKTII
jgi:hypothetical protein